MRDEDQRGVNERMDANVNVNVPAGGPRNPVIEEVNPDPVNPGPQNEEHINEVVPMDDNEINEAIQAARNAVRAAANRHERIDAEHRNPVRLQRNQGRGG
jgi:hypothetical protein